MPRWIASTWRSRRRNNGDDRFCRDGGEAKGFMMVPNALDISILETLALLDGEFVEFADGLANDKYAVWLGAGISLSKLPGLEGVAESVLEHLREKADPADSNCRYRKCLDRIIGLVGLTTDDWKEVDYSKPVAEWRDRLRIRKSLTSVYARMLDQHPQGEDPDYLVWVAVDVVGRYANPAITPGPEHLGLAALIAEGAASDTASANWDPLIERAIQFTAGTTPGLLQVRVLPDDVKDNSARARLYKFHGCAARAGLDEGKYREKVVGRASQIHGWAEKAENKVIANKLLDLAVSKATLMLGLSTQDTNIQSIFVVAQQNLPSAFPTHPPAVILSEDAVGADQLSLLQNFYKADYASKAQHIEVSALLKSYGQSLLPALWLYVLSAKLEAFLALGAPNLPAADVDQLRAALRDLRNAVASAAEPKKQEQFMLQVLPIAGRAVSLFRDGKELPPPAGAYTPLTIASIGKSLADPNLPSSGLLQAAIAAALFGCGQSEGHWSCSLGDPASTKSGVIRVTGAARSAEVFFASSAQAAGRLVAGGRASDDDDAIIVHSHEIPPAAARHPSAPPGRTLRRGRREISVASVAAAATSLDALLRTFKSQIAL
jgi:hypothetical protein